MNESRYGHQRRKKMYDEERILNEYGINATNFLLFRTMDGDKSDGIPGIKGAGIKTLLKMFPWLASPHKHSIDDLLKSAEPKRKQFKLCEQIVNSEDQLLFK